MSNNKSIVKEKNANEKHADASLSKGKIELAGEVSSVTDDEKTETAAEEVCDGDYTNLLAG